VDIANGVGAAPRSKDSREAHENRSLLALGTQEGGGSDVAIVAIADELSIGTSASGMDNTLGYLLISHVSVKRLSN
jgi:hypothetical protein